MKLKLFYLVFILSAGLVSVQGQSFKAMSFNIRYDNPSDNENSWDNRKEEVVELLCVYNPGIVGIQEGLYNQVKYISDNTSKYAFIGVGRDDGHKKGEFTAIYYDSTRFKLVTNNTIWLSKTPEKVSVGWDASMERICTYGHFIDIDAKKDIYIFNAHFDHLGSRSRKKSAKLILKTIHTLGIADSALIVMGDFNSLPSSKPIKVLLKELDDPVEKLKKSDIGPPGTFNNFDPYIIPNSRIDYLLTSNLKIEGYKHINDKRKNQLCISDHLPVIAEVSY